MQFNYFPVSGPVEIKPKLHGDHRGYFAETFREELFSGAAGVVSFVQENQSLSSRTGTVRGLHFQTNPVAQGKLVRCVAGAIFDVAVDLRVGSPSYGRWIAVELDSEMLNQLWVPPGFAHGFCTLRPDTIVSYKVTDYYSPDNDSGVAWNDPLIGIDWPVEADAGTLSKKDLEQPMLADLPNYFTFEG